MAFLSEDWKSHWSISTTFTPPLLYSGPSAKPLGPLLFSPSPKTLTHLFSSPSLYPRPLRCNHDLHVLSQPQKDPFILPSVLSSIASDIFDSEPEKSDAYSHVFQNNNILQLLKCNDSDVLLFFPTGDNSDFVGFVKLSKKKLKPPLITCDASGDVFTTEKRLNSRILQLSVTSCDDTSGRSYVGFLLAITFYSADWFRVEISNPGSDLEKPVLVHLATRLFNHCIVHSCWSPWLVKESLVLLQNGDLFLFDLDFIITTDKLPVKLSGTTVAWEGCKNGAWLSCEFSCDPRKLVIACSSAVYIVDCRLEKSVVSVLANISMVDSNHSAKNDRFIAFCKAGADGLRFSVVTEYHLCLLDIRKPLEPVLQWVHRLDNPRYINILKLSELRSKSEEQYELISESGFAIILGSFWKCEFNLFCYGPSLPTPYGSVASKVVSFCDPLYAWELPSEFCLLGSRCSCGNCLLKEDFSKSMLPECKYWRLKEELALGFCIISGEMWDCSGGFTLIRLLSFGKLELQNYFPSWDLFSVNPDESTKQLCSYVEDSRIRAMGDKKFMYTRRFKYLHLDYLLGYMDGNLSKVLVDKIQNIPPHTISPTQDKRALLREILKSAGINQVESFPVLAIIFDETSSPVSIHEIGLSKMWVGLPMNLMEMGFSRYSELSEVLLDQKKVGIQFLDVPNSSQLPPFFKRKPSKLCSRLSQNAQKGDALVGPVLPLPVLLALADIDIEKLKSGLKETGDAFDVKLSHQCNDVLEIAKDIVSGRSCSVINFDDSLSLADVREEKTVRIDDSTLFIYKPSAFSDQQNVAFVENERFATFVFRKCEKKSSTASTQKQFRLDAFDDLCPVQLKFTTPSPIENDSMADFSSVEFLDEELQYNKLKNQFLHWQKNFKPYEDFCKKVQNEFTKK